MTVTQELAVKEMNMEQAAGKAKVGSDTSKIRKTGVLRHNKEVVSSLRAAYRANAISAATRHFLSRLDEEDILSSAEEQMRRAKAAAEAHVSGLEQVIQNVYLHKMLETARGTENSRNVYEGHIPSAYLAHAITVSTDGNREPEYYYDLEVEFWNKGWAAFRPATMTPTPVSAALVYFDIMAIEHSDAVVLDLSNGLSIGASVEANFAFLSGKPVIVVTGNGMRVSQFAISMTPDQNFLTIDEENREDVIEEIVLNAARYLEM